MADFSLIKLFTPYLVILITTEVQPTLSGIQHKSNILYMTDGIPLDFVRDKQYLIEKRSLPSTVTSTLDIGVKIAVESITDITNIDSTIDLYMTQVWNSNQTRNESLKLSGEDIANFGWTPDIYFILAKTVIYNNIAQYLHFEESGMVTFDQKIRVTAPCKPDIWYFPFDNTSCRIILSSYGFPKQFISLHWMENGVEFPVAYDKLSELGYEILNMSTSTYEATYGKETFEILEALISLRRISSIYLYQVYVPAASLVLVSWVTFWINGDKTGTPARASVGVMTVLSMLTICRGQTDTTNMAVSREPRLLDVYIWASFSFVIAAMIEFALSDFFRDPNFGAPGISPLHIPRYRKTNLKIDRCAQIGFPLSFLLFNCVYWGYVFWHTQKFASSDSAMWEGSAMKEPDL
ncbi:gamma-aminobutyric acid receptor subunit rho-2-like [Convolutriloba macropyga]|uniref:gamma-aminobutyric acid receptor subunit rho-2-like n=1 Tax=Convolutriloba macropyga TaxID=536237 RepID=UPI003F51D161